MAKYTKGNLVEDFTSGMVYAREILDPDGVVIAHVIEHSWEKEGQAAADVLLSHLNQE
jgi:hypothetical protein